MQHFLHLVVVLTAITYLSFFCVPTSTEEEPLSSDEDHRHPQNDSLNNEEIRGKRISTQEEKPGPSGSSHTASKYAVIGGN